MSTCASHYQSASLEQRRKWVDGRDPEAVRGNELKRSRPPEHRKRENVRLQTRRAVQRGTLKKEPCMRCGEAKVHAHHEDYSAPLDVMWLCTEHHALRHRERVVEQTF